MPKEISRQNSKPARQVELFPCQALLPNYEVRNKKIIKVGTSYNVVYFETVPQSYPQAK